MPVDVQTIGLGSGYALPVFTAGGLTATVVKVTAGDSVYYDYASTVSSSSNTGTITNGSSQTLTREAWLISAGSSQVQISNYWGGGDIESLFGSWVAIRRVDSVPLAGGTAAGQLIHTGPLGTFVAAAGAATGEGMFYLDPSDYPSSARTAKIRVRGHVTSNAVAPACTNLVYALYPVATVGGASGAVPTIATVGTVVCSATITTPSATTQTAAVSTAVAYPSAGWYCLALTVGTGGTAANANTVHGFEVQASRTAP